MGAAAAQVKVQLEKLLSENRLSLRDSSLNGTDLIVPEEGV